MKKPVLLMWLLLLAGAGVAQADDGHKVSPEEFRNLASMPMGTMKYSEYAGVSEGKAYVVVHEMSRLGQRWSKKTYWAEADKVDQQLLLELERAKQSRVTTENPRAAEGFHLASTEQLRR